MAVDSVLSHRKPDTHKGDYGHIFILAGSRGFTGAAILCANSAMRTGAGLVTLGIPESQYSIVAKRGFLEVMTKPLPETKDKTLSLNAYKKIFEFAQKADVLAIGPGVSRNHSTQGLVRKIIAKINKPIVIDADGLNALTGHLNLLSAKRYPCLCGARRQAWRRQALSAIRIMTPHPGEFSRLIGKPVTYIQKNREMLAKKFAYDYNVVLVLKGDKTIIASPDKKVYVNTVGNPGMATAGSGDVLTGMIAALLGQGLNCFEAAKIGVYLHGLAGDLAAKEKTQAGMIASDIIEKIPSAMKKIYK